MLAIQPILILKFSVEITVVFMEVLNSRNQNIWHFHFVIFLNFKIHIKHGCANFDISSEFAY